MTGEDSTKILFVSYYFPPCGSSGVFRNVRFVNNLKECGWEPSALTVAERDIGTIAYGTVSYDDSFAGIEERVDIARARAIRPSYIVIQILKPFVRLLRRLTSRGGAAVRGGAAADTAPGAKEAKTYYSSDTGPLLKLLFDLILITDQIWEWPPFAVLKGIGFMRRNGIEYIFSSSPPWNVHIVAIWLKYLCGKKWIMDLRDPIFDIESPGVESKRSAGIIKLFYRFLEYVLVKSADVIICNCDEIREYYGARYGKKRFEVITNSYEPEDFPVSGSPGYGKREGERFVISYVGILYPSIRTPDAFLEAVGELAGERPELKKLLSIRFVGESEYTGSKTFKDLVGRLGIGPMLELRGHVPHTEAVGAMLASDALLLLQPHDSTNYQIPAKLYEYIATRKPMLAVAPDGSATANIIRKHGLGLVRDPTDKDGLKKDIVAAIEGRAPAPPVETVESFSSMGVTKKLMEIVRSLE